MARCRIGSCICDCACEYMHQISSWELVSEKHEEKGSGLTKLRLSTVNDFSYGVDPVLDVGDP